MARVWVIHGPNLNLLGRRQPELYGRTTLAEINARLADEGAAAGHAVRCLQSNDEGQLVDWVQAAQEQADLLLINPGAYTHTSVALRDALLSVDVPAIEVHLTNPDGREPFRRTNLVADVMSGRVMGFGARSYDIALHGGLLLLAEAAARGDEEELGRKPR